MLHRVDSGDRSKGQRPISSYHPKTTVPPHEFPDAIYNRTIRTIPPFRQKELDAVIQQIFATHPPDDPKNFPAIFAQFNQYLDGQPSSPEYLYCTRAFSDFVFNWLRAKMADVVTQFISCTSTDEKELLTSYKKSSRDLDSLASPFKKLFQKLQSPFRANNIQGLRSTFSKQLLVVLQEKKLDLTH